jgi:hypothetical protein
VEKAEAVRKEGAKSSALSKTLNYAFTIVDEQRIRR